MNKDYLTHIEGLRGIAVSLVILFHLEINYFESGYLGVDIFFVISGYLITKHILNQSSGKLGFSFYRFYYRRAMRLLPSLIAVITVTTLISFFSFHDELLQRSFGAAIYSLTFISNIFYWQEGGYFAVSSDLKPLLHTWSLSVEEQFYIVYPLVIVLILRTCKKFLLPILLVVGCISVLSAEYFYYTGSRNAVFFHTPFRLFEFIFGAVLLFVKPNSYFRASVGANIIFCAGLSLLILSIILFDEQSPNPTLLTLIPLTAAGLLILSGDSKIGRYLLSNKLLCSLGAVSYSAYLVHWPIIVFYKLHFNNIPSALDIVIMLLIMSIFTFSLYHFVEQKFRFRIENTLIEKRNISLMLTAALFMVTTFSIVWSKGKINWRSSNNEITAQQIYKVEDHINRERLKDKIQNLAFSNDTNKYILFIGDSHSIDVQNAFASTQTNNVETVSIAHISIDSDCHISAKTHWLVNILGKNTNCAEQTKNLHDSAYFDSATHIVLAQYWSNDNISAARDLIQNLKRQSNAQIYLIGQNAIFPTFDQTKQLDTFQVNSINNVFFQERSIVDEEINELLISTAEDEQVTFLDRQSHICNLAEQICHVYDDTGRPLYIDSNHWSHTGQNLFGKKIFNSFDENI